MERRSFLFLFLFGTEAVRITEAWKALAETSMENVAERRL